MRVFAAVLAVALVAPVPAEAQRTVDTLNEDPEPDSLSASEQVDALVEGKLSFSQASSELRDAINAVNAARQADRAGKLTALLLALAAIFKLLISGLKLMGGLSWWGDKQGTVIRFATMLLGVGVYAVSSVAAGMPWWEALFLSLSGPGAVVIHEYSDLLGLKKAT